MHQNEARAIVKHLLDGITDLEVRATCVSALRTWWKAHPPNKPDPTNPLWDPAPRFQMHGDLGRAALPMFAAQKSETLAPGVIDALKEVFLDSTEQTWMMGVVEFVRWFERAGLGTAKPSDTSTVFLTRRGVRFLEVGEDDPLLPGFLDRIRVRCPNMPDGVLAQLADARACLDHALPRPAVVMMGVAYELAIETIVDS